MTRILRGRTLAAAAVAMITASAALFAQEGAKNAVVGSKDSAKWSATTLNAATAVENKRMLDSAKVATVTGEVVNLSCYLQLGKRGQPHAECGAKGVRNGQPAAILDDEGNVFLLVAEQHDARRDGQVSLAEKMAGLMAQRVTATGLLTEVRGVRALFLEGQPVAPAAAPSSAAPATPAP